MKRIYIDQDDVLCDFRGAFLKGRSIKRHEIIYPQSAPGFFINLEPLPGAIETYKELEKHFDVWILTKPSVYNLHCYTEKAQWVKNHLGFETQKKLIICCDKSLLRGDYLVDDADNAGQRDFEGEWLQFGSQKYPDWLSIKKYLLPYKSKYDGARECDIRGFEPK